MKHMYVGVLSDPAYIRRIKKDKPLESAQYMSSAGEKNQVGVIFFTYEHIDLDEMKVTGYCHEGEGWEKKTLELPKAIYDQAHTCPNSIRKKLMEGPSIRFVNEKIGFWKWETHKTLYEFPEIRKHLPETYLCKDNEKVSEMLQQYGRAILKPVHGLKAMGIILLISGNGEVKFQYRGKGKDRSKYYYGRFSQLGDLRKQFPVMGKEKYIVQQGLELVRYKGNACDVRALMQKDGNNLWHASLCVKVGPSKSDITAMGHWANIDNVELFLTRKYGSNFINLNEKIKNMSVLAAETVEKAFAPVGEIALDIGVDTDANLWLLEVNSMPGKSMFYELFNKGDLYSVLSRPAEYACYLLKANSTPTNKYSVTYLDSKKSETLHLTPEQAKALDINCEDGSISVTVGSISLSLKLEITNNNELEGSRIYFSQDLKGRLFIPENTVLQVKRLDSDHLELGPLVGVFISPKKAAALIQGKKDSVYRQLSATTKLLTGLCCFFSIGDIDWQNKLIKALIWDGSDWMSKIVPLPKVIYDRCFGKNSRSYGMELRSNLESSEYHIFNSLTKLGKWETFQVLKKYPHLEEHLPKTRIYRSNSDIVDFLKKHESIYLKPDLLYKGKGIYRLKHGPGGSYNVEYREDDKNEVIYLPNLKDLDEMLNKYLEIGWGYIIQESIQLASYKGYPFDFRLLYQKDWQGKWEPSGIVARIAAPGSIITSPRSGGAVSEFSTVLSEVFGEDINKKDGLYQEVIDVGREVVIALENEFGDCVELGLDMAIDEHGKVWIIEVNGKPLKVSFKRLNNLETMNKCLNRPVEYAVHLSGFFASDTSNFGGD